MKWFSRSVLYKYFSSPIIPFKRWNTMFWFCYIEIVVYKFKKCCPFCFTSCFLCFYLSILMWDFWHSGMCHNEIRQMALFPNSIPSAMVGVVLSPWAPRGWLPRTIHSDPLIPFLSANSSFRAIDSHPRTRCRETSLGKSRHLLRLLIHMNVNCS